MGIRKLGASPFMGNSSKFELMLKMLGAIPLQLQKSFCLLKSILLFCTIQAKPCHAPRIGGGAKALVQPSFDLVDLLRL